MPFSDEEIEAAVRDFWGSRQTGTQSGRHDRAFLELVSSELSQLGWPAQIRQQSTVPGHFRVAKSWDIVCRDSRGHPRICIEFKSQVDSYGNNENNRYEEALGSGLDIRARYGGEATLGFFLVICDEAATRSVTRSRITDIDPAFENTSHIDRRIIFAERIVGYQLTEARLYDAACVLLVGRDGTVKHPENPDLWLVNFPDKLVRAAGSRA